MKKLILIVLISVIGTVVNAQEITVKGMDGSKSKTEKYKNLEHYLRVKTCKVTHVQKDNDLIVITYRIKFKEFQYELDFKEGVRVGDEYVIQCSSHLKEGRDWSDFETVEKQKVWYNKLK